MKINRENIQRHLLEYQLSLVNKTIEDTLDDDKCYFNWTLTTEQYLSFRKYSVNLIKKIFRINRSKAEKNFDWFILGYGLRIKD